MNMTVGNTLFKSWNSHLVTYKSDVSKTQVDYYLGRRDKKEIAIDLNIATWLRVHHPT